MPGRKFIRSKRLLMIKKRYSDTPKKGDSLKTRENGIADSEVLKPCSSLLPSSQKEGNIYESHSQESMSISEILSHGWKVFRVSPIYGFHKKKLQMYAKKLKQELSAAHYRGGNTIINCSFKFRLLQLGETYEVIQVNVIGCNYKYVGYFISSMSQTDKESLSFGHFPVLFVNVRGKILEKVHNALCMSGKFFDCDIQPVSFSFKGLITIFTIISYLYVHDMEDISAEVVTLSYRIAGCPKTDSIAVALSLAAVSTVTAVFNHDFGPISNIGIISDFYNSIIEHILNVYHIDFSPARLFKVTFPHMTVSSEGLVKISSESVFTTLLPFLEDLVNLEHIGSA